MGADFPEHWQLKSIEETMDALIDYRGKTPKKTVSGIPLITAKIVKSGRIHEPSEFIAEDNYDSWMVRGLPEVGDVVVTTEAPLGEVAQIKNSNIALAQRIVTLRGKKGLLNNDFLLYAMQSGFMQHQLESRASGSTVKGIKQSELRKVLVPIPPVNEQIEIAKHLKSIDSKIELNYQINQTLESMAQTIFKSWFVDFDPVKAKLAAIEAGEDAEGVTRAAMRAISGKTDDELDQMQAGPPENYAQLKTTAGLFPSAMQDSELGEVPEGWEVGVLSDLIEFNPKRALKKGIVTLYLDMKNVPTAGHLADEVILREMKSGTKFINGDTLLARITPCLENGKTAYVDFLSDGQVGWGSTEYIVMRPKNAIPASFGYFVARLDSFRQFAIQSMTGTSGRQRANADALKALPWIKFPTEIIQAFDKIGGATLEQAKSRGDENKTLAQLRDTLLPKLLYGELSVDAIEMARGKMKE